MTGVGSAPRDLSAWMRDVNKRLVAQERRRVNGATWDGISDKPSTFPPSPHTHDWGQITGKPQRFLPSLHTHSWEQIAGKPTTFPPSEHTHTWEQITGVPSAEGITPNTLALRNASGQIGVADPTVTGHAATKGYVDRTVSAAAAPTGVILPYGGSSAPPGYLLCQGQAVSRSTYAFLFAVLGTRYGAGDGSTTFNLPDMRGRVMVGLDTAQAEFNALGNAGGAKTHTLTEAEMPAHQHSAGLPLILPGRGPTGSWGEATKTGGPWQNYQNGGSSPDTLGPAKITVRPAGGGQAHNNLQPYITLNYIIKT